MTARLTDADIDEMESAAKALDGFPGTHQILRLIAECRKRGEELAELSKKVYVPGQWSCPKCQLRLTTSTLHVADGTISADNKPQECPNGCGPMWRIAAIDELHEAYKTANKQFERAERAERELAEAYECLSYCKPPGIYPAQKGEDEKPYYRINRTYRVARERHKARQERTG